MSMGLIVAAQTRPAGGAALAEVVIATAGAVGVTTLLLVLCLGHRSGRVQLLGRLAALSARWSGLPGWAGLPAAISTVSLLTALLGMYWDISLHIAEGRDEGPLANPAHYFILAGLFGIFGAGIVAIALPTERPGPTALRVAGSWHAPLGGVLIAACGAFSLLGFPLDDFWHRLFGQDVTLWGPTHLMLIGGAAMTLVGLAVLLVEGARARPRSDAAGRQELPWMLRTRRVALTGGLLIGLSTFQAEFDFGVPQFRFVFQPILVMVAAGVALVTARLWLGRGSALGAVGFFLVVRGLLAVTVGPVLEGPTPYLPLYVVEAAVVELVALRIPRERPLAFGLWSGALIGTVGLAAEWAWTHVWMPLPWPAELFPEAALLGFAAAMAGALLGAWIGAHLYADVVGRVPRLREAAVVAAAVLAGLVGYSLLKPAERGVSAQTELTDVASGPERTVMATVTVDPSRAAEDAEWVTATAWQGGGLVVDRLERLEPGRYRTTEPIPVHGEWKALIRVHRGRSLVAQPVYLPEDPAIPAEAVPAEPRFTRALVADHEILQREQKAAVPGLTPAAYGVVLGITLALLGLLAWGLHRVAVVTR